MRSHWFALSLAIACTSRNGESSPPPSANSQQEPAGTSSAAALEVHDAGTEPSDTGASDATFADAATVWTPFARKDDIPLCVLASYAEWGNAQFLKDVKPRVSLKAGKEVQFGTYAPGCASLACVRKVTLQCWIDVAGNTLTAHTRFSGEQVVGSTCSKDCEATTAACNTPALKAGSYTLTYGDLQTTLRLPSVLKPTCIALP